MIVSSKPTDPIIPFNDIIILRPTTYADAVEILIRGLIERLSDLGITSEVHDLETITKADEDGNTLASQKRVLSLLEIETPFITNLSESDYYAFRTLMTKGRGGLWISRSGLQLDPSGDPAFCTTTGLLRCNRCECPDAPMLELSVSPKFPVGEAKAADLIIRGFRSMFGAESIGAKAETELAELDGRILIPRLYDHKPLNDHLDRIGKPPLTEMQPVVQKDRPLKLEVSTPGIFESLHFIDDELPLEPLAEHDVEIEVAANGINFVDTMVCMGSLADTEIGVDAAGTIKRVGSSVTSVRAGDRVATFCMGAYRNILRVHEIQVAKLPDGMTFEEAASVPCVYTTAYYALCNVGRLEAGETILIHSAAGGVGQAAIQLAKYIGAEIFATVGSSSKRQFLIEAYSIPEDHIFDSHELHFSKGIMRLTKGRGVDVVLNSTTGEALRKTWECVSMFGRFLEVGKTEISSNTGLEMKPFLYNTTFSGINLEHMIRKDTAKAARVFRDCFKLICERKVGLLQPISVHKWSDMAATFRTVQEGKQVGKQVIKMQPDDLVPVIPRSLGTAKLDDNSTYVIVGGLGGIGRSLVLWLAELGAKHLAIVSRSGVAKPEAKATMDELKALGVHVVSYTCDIVDPKAFSATVDQITAENPPIKGAIHSAMIVNDYFLNITTYEQWSATINVKTHGAWNMHTYLPKDLDFFVMLSSASGYIGTPKLSSYAAGNTYNDGLAQYRRSLGLKACAPGFGFIAGIGWARENVKISGAHKADYDLMAIQPPQVQSLIKSAISGYAVGDVPMPAQVATTMGTGGELQHTKLIKTRDWFNDPKFSYLGKLDVRRDITEAQSGGVDVKSALEQAPSMAHAADVVESALAAKLALSMSMAPDNIDSSKPVSAYGVDSLVSMEIRNWVGSVLKSNTGVFEILNSGPIAQLSTKIAENSLLVQESLRTGVVGA